jgi:hypothetical protein
MKKHSLMKWIAVWALTGSSLSCMTTYDKNGRSMATVDPALAVAGVAAAGLIGYAAANHHHGNNYYYGGGAYYGGGYYRPYRRCY